MVPMILKIKIPRADKQQVNIYLPLFIVWLILLPILILLLPLYLFIVLISWMKGYGRLTVMFIPMLIEVIWNLKDLKIEVRDKNSYVYLSFI
jgi:hypothetical protein